MISVFSAAIRTANWPAIFETFAQNEGEHEILFAGHVEPDFELPEFARWIRTGRIKPAQADEVARRQCRGDLVVKGGDDITFSPRALDLAEAEWKALRDPRAILSLRYHLDEQLRKAPPAPDGSDYFDSTELETWLFMTPGGPCVNSPRLPFMGIYEREHYESLGTYDRRFVSSMHDADLDCRALAAGAPLHWCAEAAGREHLDPSWAPAECYTRAYSVGDRRLLDRLWEPKWQNGGNVRGLPADHLEREEPVEEFEDRDDLATVSQGRTDLGRWPGG